ncbi:hypothetical protein [Paraburkholderia hospita]|uniref:hypothetical protein n=1 Tax=Paraburkholderia hospita TaxID=169430 RepID=UPI000B3451E1|nr:hypothetical protein [Paraburkholderia hospita]OUL72163.1 hypothetical protein CA603_46240 [Paraburkholderia hospita]
MAILFDKQARVVPTWLAAAQHLVKMPGREAMNIVLEIPDPLTITADDRAVIARVDAALAKCNLTLNTVAGTIFPLAIYRRHGRPGYYEAYKSMLKRGKKKGSWGTYALRMIDRASADGRTRINPLEALIKKLSDAGQPSREDGKMSSFTSAYELGISDPETDLGTATLDDVGGEIPTYDARLDALQWLGLPCLSHLSFKRIETETGYAVNLTAMYRSHHYCARALGNLIGLAQLLSFVAKEAKLEVGTLTCISSHAVLDADKWGGVPNTRATLGLPPR